MQDRVCLITGGTSGVGQAIARGLARLSATVIIVSSKPGHGKVVTDTLSANTGNRHVYYRHLDLADLEAVHTFAGRFTGEFGQLHVLSNNAAVLTRSREVTRQGLEKTLAVNYLSHFLLTHLLGDLMKKSSPARIMTVSGNPLPLLNGTIALDDLQLERHFRPLRAMFRTAVAKVMFSYELARRLAGSGVTSNTFHPGLVKSNLNRNYPPWLRLLMQPGQWFFSRECPTGVYLASAPVLEGVSGRFFKNQRPVHLQPDETFLRTGRSLWDASLELTGLS